MWASRADWQVAISGRRTREGVQVVIEKRDIAGIEDIEIKTVIINHIGGIGQDRGHATMSREGDRGRDLWSAIQEEDRGQEVMHPEWTASVVQSSTRSEAIRQIVEGGIDMVAIGENTNADE